MLVKWFIKICVWMILSEFWLVWAMIALPVAAIASASGHRAASRQWTRSLDWQRALRF
jgi:hypothetical protein